MIAMESPMNSVAPVRKRFRRTVLSMAAQPEALPPLPFRQVRELGENRTVICLLRKSTDIESMAAQPLGLPPLPFRQEREHYEAQKSNRKRRK